ncbi:MAG: M1 family aminopeptidase [Gemmatimonadales bacterium]
MVRPQGAVALCVALLVPLSPGPRAEQESYEQLFGELRRLAPNGERVAAVRNLLVRRDLAEFHLTEGALHLLTPVAGRVVGAAFTGTGTLVFVPPLDLERGQLYRLLHDSTIHTPITAAVFLFADTTLAELERRVTFAAGAAAPGLADHVGDALNFLIDSRDQRADRSLMAALLNGDQSGYFAGYAKRQRGEDLMVKIDPHEVEEVRLLRRGRQGARTQTICQFQRAEDLASGIASGSERPEPMEIPAYRIEATIGKNFDFAATATVRIAARRDGIRWVPLLLYNELDVDSVLGEAGARAPFFRAKRSPELWVRLDPALGRGETRAIRITYHGDLIAHGSLMEQFLRSPTDARRAQLPNPGDRWSFIKATATWFPRYSFWQPADMELIFRTPSTLRFASIGRLADSSVAGGVRTTRWVTEAPTRHASFNIGEFQEFEVTDPRIPPVTVHMNREAHLRIQQLVVQQRDPERQVGGDLANSLAFFTNVFGPPLFSRYYATEIPFFHGQAFPGLIHLSWWTFQSAEPTGASEVFRAHEMAHQWWGIGVEPAGYRDAWVSEGFATFAGLWYMQLILRDNEKYFKQLRDWRDEIRAKRDDAPPIGLGYRAADSDPELYDLMVYRKGAWVLHMLRNLMLDLRTMGDDAFKAMMQEFYGNFRGRYASTKDFQDVVERHTGEPMAWFFEQWVNGTAVPTYVYSWRADPEPDGKYRLRLRVRQEDAPPSFTMRVPLLIDLGGGAQALTRATVHGTPLETELLLPAAPTRVVLNPLESVLADVRQEDWQ